MAIKRTTIEEHIDQSDPEVVRTTKTVIDPNIHTAVTEDRETVTHSPSASTVQQTRVIHEPVVKGEHPQQAYETKKSILRFSEVIWTILGIIELLLGFRIILKVLAADPTSGFASFIYGLSYPFAAPFAGILRTNYSVETGSVFEWSSIIAAVVYIVIAYGIIHLITLVRPVTPEEVDSKV